MVIRPLYDRVVVKRKEEEAKSNGGIIIPDSASEKPAQGEVVAVGSGAVTESGGTRELAVKPGDVVLFGKYSGTEVKVDFAPLLVGQPALDGVTSFIYSILLITPL